MAHTENETSTADHPPPRMERSDCETRPCQQCKAGNAQSTLVCTLCHLSPFTLSVLLFVCLLSVSLVGGQQSFENWYPQDNWSPWIKPWDNFDRYVHAKTYYGYVKGFSVPMYLEDEYWRDDWGEYPKWFMRRINCFLGVPYAQAPLGLLRFQVSS